MLKRREDKQPSFGAGIEERPAGFGVRAEAVGRDENQRQAGIESRAHGALLALADGWRYQDGTASGGCHVAGNGLLDVLFVKMGGALHLLPLRIVEQEAVADGGTTERANAQAEADAEQVRELAAQEESPRVIGEVMAPAVQFALVA